jgi:suppressor of ftsI
LSWLPDQCRPRPVQGRRATGRGTPLKHRAWLDTANVPYHGSVEVILDFADPVIKGTSVFHCRLLNHEENKGMMAKILLQY